jgi:hypothetical protein
MPEVTNHLACLFRDKMGRAGAGEVEPVDDVVVDLWWRSVDHEGGAGLGKGRGRGSRYKRKTIIK